jgi:hypothetical protein
MKISRLVFILAFVTFQGCSEKENINPPRLVCSYDWLTNPANHSFPEIIDTSGLYKRPAYKLAKSDSSLYLYPANNTSGDFEGGWWELIEIADCSAGKVYYPCALNPGEESMLGFDPDKHPDLCQSYPDLFPYENFCIATTWNSSTFTFKYLNDSTILTSHGGATQAGVSPEAAAFFKLYLSLLQNTTLIIKKHRNLLELRTPDNVFLRFYK